MDTKKVAVLFGDGIGPEVCQQALRVLDVVAERHGLKIQREHGLLGGVAYDQHQKPLPEETLNLCRESDAVLLGAVGGTKWEHLPSNLRPEKGLLELRSGLGLFANLRPAKVYPALLDSSPIKNEIVTGADLMIIRELAGGIYFGLPRGRKYVNKLRQASNSMLYDESQIIRIARVGFETARERNKKLCSVDKANVLEVSDLWREVVTEESKNYPEVELSHMYVDNAAMQIVQDPKQFDCILTSNLFGDILSDIAATISGSIGLLPSASLGDQTALYEPVHGSAVGIAGKNQANPLATILSVAMMFKHSFFKLEAYEQISLATERVLNEYRTPDIARPDKQTISCTEMGDQVLKQLENL